MNNAPLSSEQMAAVLDNAPVAVYVCAVDNFELLYANQLAMDALSFTDTETVTTCYAAAGYDKPCPFCRTDKMSRDSLLVREFFHPGNLRTYQLSGKLIDWEGRPAHIEYILDITDRKREEDEATALKDQLQATFSNIPCGLCVYQAEGTSIVPVFHNPAFYEIMGYSDEHIDMIEQKTDFLNVHPEDVEELKSIILKAVRENSTAVKTYRVFSDVKKEYRLIRLEGAVKPQKGGKKLLYGVYTDVTKQLMLEEELAGANEKMQDIINAIPGGVAIYKVTDKFETVYFSDGVAELSGRSVAEYHELIKQDAADMIYFEDREAVIQRAVGLIASRGAEDIEFRKQHKNGGVVWVRAHVKWIGEEDGFPLLHCVFHNISDMKEAQFETEHLVNSIPGGIASFQVEGTRFVPTFFSDGVMALTGFTREEYETLFGRDAFDAVYEPDRERVVKKALSAVKSGQAADMSFRVHHKDGSLVWVHFNGRRMGPVSDSVKFYAVYTGMSAETRLFQSIANDTADGVYVIDKENYDLLYANESTGLFMDNSAGAGQKCYAALYNRTSPCEFCTLCSHAPDGVEHDMEVDGDRFFSTRFKETDWNGIRAYVKFVRDITADVKIRKEKERLEQYFQTVLKYLPGGVAVVRHEADGTLVPEFLSEGFAAITGMTMDEAWALYQRNAMDGVHPNDRERVNKQMADYVASGESQCELVYRLRKGKHGYLWVKNTLTMIQNEGGERRVYAVYHDMTRERAEQEQIRKQYKELILQHYRAPGPNALIVGHCNVTQNRIIEIEDHTNSDLLKTFGTDRNAFFTGLSGLISDRGQRQAFLNIYLNEPAKTAFANKDTEQVMDCFVKLPKEKTGRLVRFKMNLVETPDTGGITGILTVTDVTNETISQKILHQLSATGYDFVADLDLTQDTYTVLASSKNASCLPPPQGSHSQWIANMAESGIVPRDREQYATGLDPKTMLWRLTNQGPYTISYSMTAENGDIRTKNMTVSAVDLRIGRVCLARSDITESLREQQGLLHMIAYTFEMACFVSVSSGSLTMYTRETVLNSLPPYVISDYDEAIGRFVEEKGAEENLDEVRSRFDVENLQKQLSDKPEGYDFLFSYRGNDGVRFKQINVLWGDLNHRTICLVRADVTEMLSRERQTKANLENALALAKEANRAKSDFLSAMSHDIRTPMNAIMGMTALAVAHIDDQNRVADCLQKISVSSKHLLSLINDILDMSKIEQSKITLNHMKISLKESAQQLSSMMAPQAKAAGVQFQIKAEEICHNCFYGDALRMNQIFINILSNAIKFTPEGGSVCFTIRELGASDAGENMFTYRFTASDTGIGMTEEFLKHIYEPFTRGAAMSSIEGTGLGLSITKGLVDLMDGTISVKSQVGKGTTFCVDLTLEAAEDCDIGLGFEAGNAFAGEGAETLFSGRRYLVAEDNAINAEILCELLSMFGAQTVVTTDGAQAAETFQNAAPGTFDAVLMDIQMPRMNGYEATRAIREMERPDARKIPIIAMTANAFAEDVQASIDAGMTAHIAKPINIELLKSTLLGAMK